MPGCPHATTKRWRSPKRKLCMSKKSTCNLKAHLHWDHIFTQDWQKRAKQMNIVNMTNMMNSAECGAYNKCNWICSTLVTSKCCLHFLWVFQSSLWLNSRKEPAMASNLAVGATKKQDVVGGNNDPEMDSKKICTYICMYNYISMTIYIYLYHYIILFHQPTLTESKTKTCYNCPKMSEGIS